MSYESFTRPYPMQPDHDEVEEDALYDCVKQQSERDETFHQLYHVYFLLQRRLNVDVARMIVSEMQHFEIYKQRRRPIDPLHIMEFNSPQACFIGGAIQARARIQHPVRRVLFRFESKDQGWVTDRNSGSWTWCAISRWYTAGIVPGSPDKPSNDAVSDLTDLLFTVPGLYHGDEAHNDADREYHRQHPMHETIVREREVLRNDVGCRNYEVNTVTWSSESSSAEEAAWVLSLQRGDRVVVRAWAQFAGWQNSIRCTSVSICNAAIV